MLSSNTLKCCRRDPCPVPNPILTSGRRQKIDQLEPGIEQRIRIFFNSMVNMEVNQIKQRSTYEYPNLQVDLINLLSH
jgi:hypothetical protein